jgi:hypothetical protein
MSVFGKIDLRFAAALRYRNCSLIMITIKKEQGEARKLTRRAYGSSFT